MRKQIMVVTHERSGTHLAINIINHKNDGAFKALGRFSKATPNEFFTVSKYVAKVHQDLILFQNYKEFAIKSHHQIEFFTGVLSELFNKYHVIYVLRDIKDILVSYYKFLNGFGFDSNGQTIPIEGFPEFKDWIFMKPSEIGYKYFESLPDPHIFIEPETYIDRWKIHVQGWLTVKDKILIIKYEEILNEFPKTKDEIENFISMEIANKIPDKNDINLPNFGPNKGIVGSHLEFMDKELIQKIDALSFIPGI